MRDNCLRDVIYGGIRGLMDNDAYFYRSSVPDYSTWSEEGKRAVATFIELMTVAILKEENKELDRRAKDMVIKELKGINNGN